MIRKERCENCNGTENLHKHHLDRNRKNNWDENYMVLCIKCHHALHSLVRAALGDGDPLTIKGKPHMHKILLKRGGEYFRKYRSYCQGTYGKPKVKVLPCIVERMLKDIFIYDREDL